MLALKGRTNTIDTGLTWGLHVRIYADNVCSLRAK